MPNQPGASQTPPQHSTTYTQPGENFLWPPQLGIRKPKRLGACEASTCCGHVWPAFANTVQKAQQKMTGLADHGEEDLPSWGSVPNHSLGGHVLCQHLHAPVAVPCVSDDVNVYGCRLLDTTSQLPSSAACRGV